MSIESQFKCSAQACTTVDRTRVERMMMMMMLLLPPLSLLLLLLQ